MKPEIKHGGRAGKTVAKAAMAEFSAALEEYESALKSNRKVVPATLRIQSALGNVPKRYKGIAYRAFAAAKLIARDGAKLEPARSNDDLVHRRGAPPQRTVAECRKAGGNCFGHGDYPGECACTCQQPKRQTIDDVQVKCVANVKPVCTRPFDLQLQECIDQAKALEESITLLWNLCDSIKTKGVIDSISLVEVKHKLSDLQKQ